MSTLYLDRRNLTLKLDGHAMAFYEDGGKRGTVPLKMLEKVVIRGNVDLESRLLCALGQHQVDVLFLSGRGSHQRSQAFSHGHNDIRRRLAQYRVFWDQSGQLDMAVRLVSAKLENQRQLLNDALQERPDLRKPLSAALQTLEGIRDTLDHAADDTLSLSCLRGYEGSAAAAYFAGFKRLFPSSLNFNQRNRRPPTDPVNACLSLGYTLLHFEAVSVCHMVGLEPMLGFYHDPSFGRESLACDLIEPLRPRLDRFVWSLFRDRQLRVEHFSDDNNRCLLNKAGRKNFYAAYENFAHPVRRLLRLQGYRLAKSYLDAGNGVVT